MQGSGYDYEIRESAFNGDIDIIKQYVTDSKNKLGIDLLDYAARGNQFDVFKYLWELGYRLGTTRSHFTLNHCASKGYFKMIKHLVGLGYEVTPEVIKSAIQGNKIITLKYLLKFGIEDGSYLGDAVECGNLDMVKIFVNANHVVSCQNVKQAIHKGYENVVIYVLTKNVVQDLSANLPMLVVESILMRRIKLLNFLVGDESELKIYWCIIRDVIECVAREHANIYKRKGKIYLDDMAQSKQLMIWFLQILSSKFIRQLDLGECDFRPDLYLDSIKREIFKTATASKSISTKNNLLKKILRPTSMAVLLSYL
jgi:hypothetical protein